jgi:hypothetical protein
MPPSPVRNAGLPKPSKCRLIPESFFIGVPVVVLYFVLKLVFAVSIVHIRINTVRPARKRMPKLHKRTPSALAGTSPKFQSAEFRGGGRTPPVKVSLRREIEPAADGMIDLLVYELSHKGMIYGLSEDEVKIVES